MSKILNILSINYLSQFITALINLIFIALAARLLSFEEFGYISLIFIIYSSLAVVIEFGSQLFHIQQNEFKYKEISFSLFLINLISFFILNLLIFFLYDQFIFLKSIKQYLIYISISLFFFIFTISPYANLKKNNSYEIILKLEFKSQFISLILSIFLLLNDFGIFAFIAKLIIDNLLKLIFLIKYIECDFRIKIKLNSFIKLTNIFFFQFINLIAGVIDKYFIGVNLSISELGIYSRTQNSTMMINNYFTSPLMTPILTAFNNKKYIDRDLLSSQILYLISGSLILLVSINSDMFILILLGKSWLNFSIYIKFFSLLCISKILNHLISISFFNSSKINLLPIIPTLQIVLMVSIGFLYNYLNLNLIIFTIITTLGCYLISLAFRVIIIFKNNKLSVYKLIFIDLLFIIYFCLGNYFTIFVDDNLLVLITSLAIVTINIMTLISFEYNNIKLIFIKKI